VFNSARRLQVDPLRLVALGGVTASVTGAAVWLLLVDLLGAATPELDIVCSALVFYIVVSAPRRIMDARRISQSREAVFLATVSAASAQVVGSRNRVIILLRSRDEEIAKALASIRKALYLGFNAGEATASASSKLASYSASNAIQRAGLPSASMSEGGEETHGLEVSEQMGAETKLPIFMTVAFFTPIMLLLYAVFSHITEPQRLVELVTLELIILDLAFYLCS
jgi:hypothetical protein